MKLNRILILTGISVFVFLLLLSIAIPAYLRSLDDNLAIINYVCTIGLKPTSFGGWKVHKTETHIIDMDTCKWMTLEDNKKWHQERRGPQVEVGREGVLLNDGDERQEISQMSCQELRERHDSENPYRSLDNLEYIESRIVNCDLTEDWRNSQEGLR